MKWLIWFEQLVEDFFINVFHDPIETKPQDLPMNQEPIKQNTLSVVLSTNGPMIDPDTNNPDLLFAWDTPENCRHNVRAIADLEGLTLDEKNDFSSTVHCESNYNPKCIHPNIINGHISSTDFGILQINDYWHIGPGKDFPSSDFVLNNPEACVRWGAKQWKAGNGKMWVCKLKNMNLHYSA